MGRFNPGVTNLVHRFQISRSYLAFVPSHTERSHLLPHPARAARSSPAPGRGAGAVMAISSGKPRQGVVLTPVSRKNGKNRPARTSEKLVLPRDLPVQWTVMDIAMGVGLTGRGRAPSPVSASCLQRPDSIPTDLPYACNSLPRRRVPVRSSSQPPPQEGGSTGGYQDANPQRVGKKIDTLLR